MSGQHCFCTKCERARFEVWREEASAADDEPKRLKLASAIIASIALRFPWGLATDLMNVVMALEVAELDDAASMLAEMVETEDESMRLNPDLAAQEQCELDAAPTTPRTK